MPPIVYQLFVVIVTLTAVQSALVSVANEPTVNASATDEWRAEIEGAQRFSNVTRGILNDYVQRNLFGVDHAKSDVVLANAETNLAACERRVTTINTIWQYKVCATEVLRQSLAELAMLSPAMASRGAPNQPLRFF